MLNKILLILTITIVSVTNFLSANVEDEEVILPVSYFHRTSEDGYSYTDISFNFSDAHFDFSISAYELYRYRIQIAMSIKIKKKLLDLASFTSRGSFIIPGSDPDEILLYSSSLWLERGFSNGDIKLLYNNEEQCVRLLQPLSARLDDPIRPPSIKIGEFPFERESKHYLCLPVEWKGEISSLQSEMGEDRLSFKFNSFPYGEKAKYIKIAKNYLDFRRFLKIDIFWEHSWRFIPQAVVLDEHLNEIGAVSHFHVIATGAEIP